MANNKSALKRIRINERNRLENKFYTSSVRTLIKMFFKKRAVFIRSRNIKDRNDAQRILSTLFSVLDKGTKKKIFHVNMAARKKSQLVYLLKYVKFI